MVTKKWVDGKLEAHRQAQDGLDKRLEALEEKVGEPHARYTGFMGLWTGMFESPEPPSVYEMINKICEHLGIRVEREKVDKIIAKKIKPVKK